MEYLLEVEARVLALELRLPFFPQLLHQRFGILAEVDIVVAFSAQPHHQTVLLAFRSVSTTEDMVSLARGLSAYITSMCHFFSLLIPSSISNLTPKETLGECVRSQRYSVSVKRTLIDFVLFSILKTVSLPWLSRPNRL